MSDFRWGDDPLDAQLDSVRDFLMSESRRSEQFVGPEIARILSREGKLLRPAMVILAGRLGPSGNPDLAGLAAAVEMIHLATLVHDDFIDGAVARRGIPALHRNIGGTRAVLAGDWLLARALSIAGRYHTPALYGFLTDRIEELCRSEIRQDAAAGDLTIDRAAYLVRIDGKTGALFRLACRAGAETAGAAPEVLDLLDRWAITVGRAFQMDDDALDYLGRSLSMGKTVGVDLKSGLSTLPLIIARESGDPLTMRITGRRNAVGPWRRMRIRKRVNALGAAGAARNEAGRAYAEARNLAAGLPGSGPEDLSRLIDRLEGRTR